MARTSNYSDSEKAHRANLLRAVIASTIGTSIEWYDFFLYSTVTGLVFAKEFFPNSDPFVGTLQADLCGRFRCTARWCFHLRTLWRSHWP